ncbi:uncharacterized protein LOC131258569 [Anopheles coustani]|uniref:uncharacterized protein LOC131258569 n=1 Tax=Anopheles coustani TaxID=139045 RepID=UPI00265AB3E7|nr:uncharacterized protein LOC131258569 [Anopheles coustani]
MEDMYENSLMDSWPTKKPKRKTDMSQEDCLYFIHLFKKHACLWKRTHSDYRDKVKRHKAWEAMSQITGYPKGELRHKWNSLFSSFRHYRAIYNKSKKLLGSKDAQHPKWFAYRALSFLDHQVQYDKPPSPGVNSEEDTQPEIEDFATYFLEPKLELEPPEIEDIQIEMLEPEVTPKTVTSVNIHDKTVVCKTVPQPETKRPRMPRNLPIQNVNDPELNSYASKEKPFPLSEDPLRIGRENQPTASTERQTPFRSFANLIEQELCHLSKEHAAMAQMDIYRIIGEYKLKDIRQCTSNSNSADKNLMESSPTRTEMRPV